MDNERMKRNGILGAMAAATGITLLIMVNSLIALMIGNIDMGKDKTGRMEEASQQTVRLDERKGSEEQNRQRDMEQREERKEDREIKENDLDEYIKKVSTQKQDSKTEESSFQQGEKEIYLDADYILPGSDRRYLDISDLEGLSADECRLARNELYARHGRLFDDEKLQAYFDGKEWYEGTIKPSDFKEGILNDYEVYNRDLIVRYEKEKGYR